MNEIVTITAMHSDGRGSPLTRLPAEGAEALGSHSTSEFAAHCSTLTDSNAIIFLSWLDGSTHWSCRKLASELGMSKSTVQRILTQARLKPHRLERYLASDDPKPKRRTPSVCTWIRPSMRPCSV
jgi:hypothetical protein